MKAFIFAILLTLSFCYEEEVQTTPEVKMDFDDLLDVLRGIFESWEVNKEEVEKLLLCVSDMKDIEHEIEIIMEELKKIDIFDILKLVEIIGKLFAAFQRIFKFIQPCLDSVEEIKKLVEKVFRYDLFEFVKRLFMHLKNDGKILYEHVKSMLKYFKEGDYNKFGYHFGEILEILFLKD